MMRTWIVALLGCAGAGLVSGAESMTVWRTVGTVSAGLYFAKLRGTN